MRDSSETAACSHHLLLSLPFFCFLLLCCLCFVCLPKLQFIPTFCPTCPLSLFQTFLFAFTVKVCVCASLYTCPYTVLGRKTSYVTWASTAPGGAGGGTMEEGGGGFCLCKVASVYLLYRAKDSLVFAILSSAGFTLWGKPSLLSFYFKFIPLAHTFACYSVLALSCTALH